MTSCRPVFSTETLAKTWLKQHGWKTVAQIWRPSADTESQGGDLAPWLDEWAWEDEEDGEEEEEGEEEKKEKEEKMKKKKTILKYVGISYSWKLLNNILLGNFSLE